MHEGWLRSGKPLSADTDSQANDRSRNPTREDLDRIARLARRGRLQEAWEMLSGLPCRGAARVPMLDLGARILAQQGRF